MNDGSGVTGVEYRDALIFITRHFMFITSFVFITLLEG
jgi:hypothetical protein